MIDFIKRVWKGEFEYNVDKINEYYDNSPFWEKIKYYSCHPDNGIANVLYLFYGDLECTCCAFIRGLIIGSVITGGILCLI